VSRIFGGRSIIAVAVLFLAAACAQASPIYGTAAVGSASLGVGGTTLATAFIDFFSTLPLCSIGGLGVPGCFTVLSGNDNFVAGSTATVQDLDAATTGGHISGAISIPDWIVFSNGVHLDLTSVTPGVAANCATLTPAQLATAGTSCNVVLGGETSPIVLQNLGSSVSAGFAVRTNGFTGTRALTSVVDGVFTSQFVVDPNTGNPGVNILQILTFIGGGGTLSNSWSGTFVAEVPEPSTAFFVLGGLLLVSGLVIRPRRK